MTYNELMEEVEGIDAEEIPSDPESVVEQSEEEEEVVNAMISISQSDSESDSEENIPLSVIQHNLIKASNKRNWSKSTVPEEPGNFTAESGISESVKSMDSPTPGKIFQLFF